MKEKARLLSTAGTAENTGPVARTLEGTCEHYGWTRTYVFGELANGNLVAVKAGRRTLVTTESADRLFAALPRAAYRAPKAAAGKQAAAVQ